MLQQATNIQLVGLVHEEAHYLNTEKNRLGYNQETN